MTKVKVPTIMSCNNGDFMMGTAIDGRGLCLIPDFVCYKAIKSGQLLPILCDFKANHILNAYAVYPQNRHLSVRVKKLINYLSVYFGDKPYWQVLDG
jgi:DNA-binding transcriptional LysR family regulator